MPSPVRVGDRFSAHRTFTVADVEAFARLTRDEGRHHLTPDASGRVMVHGLLVAALPTQLGGRLHYIAREMRFEYLRPVFSGDTVEAELTVLRAEEKPDRVELELAVVCRNQLGKEVLRGTSLGLIRYPSGPPEGGGVPT